MAKDMYGELLDKDIFNHINKKIAKPNRTIKEHTDDLLEVLDLIWNLGYIKEERIHNLVKIACVYHDIGKINNEFQKRINQGKKASFDEEKEIAHNILSLFFIKEELFENKDDYFRVVNAVVNHHNYCNIYKTIDTKEELIKSLLNEFKYDEGGFYINSLIADIGQDIEAIKIKGYLHKCDYSASSGNKAEYKNDFLEESLNNLLNKWKKDNKNSSWNELQEFCIENKDENIIAIAQTGMGKTEAGLLWMGNNKGFFILPIRTAINAIYDRIKKEILNEENLDERVGLLHSSSLEYLLAQSDKKENNEIKYNEKEDSIDKKEEQEILNYDKTAKQLSLPINISTIDQLFDFVFKYPTYELKLTTLAYSKVIIDEIQMYGPELLAYLVYGLERIVEQGGKIAILTATLPPFVKDLLSKNIKFNTEVFTDDSKRHNLKVFDERINVDDIYDKYVNNEELDKSNKILVVCNSITEAQSVYEQLNEKMEENKNKLHILHSKFIRDERLAKESEIITFGKTYKEEDDNNKNKPKKLNKQSGIWISTSIVEASLDIDFDYLFTELQDLNSLFQRLGRCNRKGKKDSSETNCFVYTQINEKSFINGDKGYIDKDIFDLSKEAISSCDGQISELEKIQLIDTYLTMDKIKNSNYIKKYINTYDFIKILTPSTFDAKDAKLRNILSRDIIPSPIYKTYNGEIKKLELQLKEKSLNSKENKTKKIELQNKLKKYTVSVHPNHISNYYRALKNGQAIKFDNVRVSDYEYIPVIECEYSELGYRQKKFKNPQVSDINDFMF